MKSGVFYFGHINAIVRERMKDEFQAGPTLPLIDQAVVGASGGTFDIEISDQWEGDKTKFLSKSPALVNIDIKKSILPPFNRSRAEKWWWGN